MFVSIRICHAIGDGVSTQKPVPSLIFFPQASICLMARISRWDIPNSGHVATIDITTYLCAYVG